MPKRTKVAIVGFTQHGVQAPWANDEWDIWGLNDLHGMVEQLAPGLFKTDRVQWFQLHHKTPTEQFPGARDETHSKWLTEQTCPIWMWEHHDAIPASKPYPIREILTESALPHGKPLCEESYFNNTISWMIALAIRQGYRTIGLYGVDMAMDGVHGESEYAHQRPSVEYFVGVARGLGIDVILPAESEVLKCGYLYGWDNSTWARRKFLDRAASLEQSEAQAVADYEHIKREHLTIGGQVWGLERQAELLAALKEHAPQALDAEPVKALAAQHEKALAEGRNNATIAANELEAAKRRLHETRGAWNDIKWVLRNYFPGDGATQDVPRTPRSVVLEEPTVEKSDGQAKARKIKNRLAGVKV